MDLKSSWPEWVTSTELVGTRLKMRGISKKDELVELARGAILLGSENDWLRAGRPSTLVYPCASIRLLRSIYRFVNVRSEGLKNRPMKYW